MKFYEVTSPPNIVIILCEILSNVGLGLVNGKGGGKISPFNLLYIIKMIIKIENWPIEELTGYKPISTFYTDFSIADRFGTQAIEDTFNRSFNMWKCDYMYMTELSLVLNWKIWRWYEVNDEYAELYDRLWRQLDEWCVENLKDESLEYYYKTTD